MSLLARDVREIGFVVSMMQIIFGSALGFIIGQGVLYGLQRSMASFRGSAFLAGFIKYAGVVATAACTHNAGCVDCRRLSGSEIGPQRSKSECPRSPGGRRHAGCR